jgi:hypothetical protein
MVVGSKECVCVNAYAELVVLAVGCWRDRTNYRQFNWVG